MSGGGGGGDTTTTQKADPWSGVQPYLSSAYQQASGLYQPGMGPQYYPGQQVATPSQVEQGANANLLENANSYRGIGDTSFDNLMNMSQAAGNQLNWGANSVDVGLQGTNQIAGQASGGIGQANAGINGLFNQANNTSAAGANAMGYMGALGNAGNTALGSGLNSVNSSMSQLNAAGDPANNPYFQQALQSAIRPVTQQFQEQVLPGIKQGAQDAGQLGSSRQGIAEGIANRGYMDTVGDISANMGNAAYAQGLQALQASGQLGSSLTGQGLGALSGAGSLGSNLYGQTSQNLAQGGQLGAGLGSLAGSLYGNQANLGANMMQNGQTAMGQATALGPTAWQSIFAPGQQAQQIGQQQTADQQAQIDAAMKQYNYQQNLPYTMMSDYLQLLQGAPGGQTTSTQSGGGGSRVTGALGGAATGAAIGSVVPGIGTGIGAGVGALYGLFA